MHALSVSEWKAWIVFGNICLCASEKDTYGLKCTVFLDSFSLGLNMHPSNLQYKLLLSHSIAFKKKCKREHPLMGDRKTGVVWVCVYVSKLGLGWRGVQEQIISPAISHGQRGRLTLHRLFYLEWARIWIDWLLKLLFCRSFEKHGKGNQLLAVKACCQKKRWPPVQTQTTSSVSVLHT